MTIQHTGWYENNEHEWEILIHTGNEADAIQITTNDRDAVNLYIRSDEEVTAFEYGSWND